MNVRRPDPPKTAGRAGWLGRIPVEPKTARNVLLAAAILAIPAFFWWDYLTGDWGPFGRYGSYGRYGMWKWRHSEAALTEADYRKAGFTFPIHRLATGAEAKFALYTPPSYAKSVGRTYPLVVFLHGHGERGEDGVKPLKNGLPQVLIHQFPQWNLADLEFFAVFPQGVTGFWQPGEEDVDVVMGIVSDIERSYRIDPDRIYLTGISTGGAGVWELAGAYPDKWAAIVPVSGFLRPDGFPPMAKHIPCWCFHGGTDKAAPVTKVREMIRRLQASGGAAWCTEFPNHSHNIWNEAYQRKGLYEWMWAQRRGARAVPPPNINPGPRR
jgi:predicted esterase